MYPFTIRLVNRTIQESAKQPVRCKLDPGSQVTGIAIVREDGAKQVVLSLIELTHRGPTIRDTLQSRKGKRKRRRFQLRYRAPRYENRAKPVGWLPPSLRHRIETIVSWVNRLRKRVPLTGITCEQVRFDTQKLMRPEIQGIEYQQGTRFGYEIREYLLEKWGRQCAYCNIRNVPLQIDHMIPKSLGGSNRIGNLTLACISCNQKKVHGFQTGDQIIASVPSGKKRGTYSGRVAIRASGYFNIQTANGVVQGISSKNCVLIQHADGYHYLNNLSANLNSQIEEQRFLPDLKDRVSALSIG